MTKRREEEEGEVEEALKRESVGSGRLSNYPSSDKCLDLPDEYLWMVDAKKMKKAVLRIMGKYPNNFNPSDSHNNCLYTGANGEHCLVGQLIVETDPKLERYLVEGHNASEVIGEILKDRFVSPPAQPEKFTFNSPVREYLIDTIQSLADGPALYAYFDIGVPRRERKPKWGSLRPIVKDIFKALDK